MTILSAVVQWAKHRAHSLKDFSSNLTKIKCFVM